MLTQPNVFDSISLSQWDDIEKLHHQTEEEVVSQLLAELELSVDQISKIQNKAEKIAAKLRKIPPGAFSVESAFKQYNLASEEGLALMCLAEALLRIPDKATRLKLIKDKVGNIDWSSQKGESNVFTKFANMGLSSTGKLLDDSDNKGILGALKSITQKISQPFIHRGMVQAIQIMGKQFVLGESIQKALRRAKSDIKNDYLHSYDMLGEAARTFEDAERYYQKYHQAITAIGKSAEGHSSDDIYQQPSISIKLSALHPRFEVAHYEQVMEELAPKVLLIAKHARECSIGLTIDAEEVERNIIGLEIFRYVFTHDAMKDWDGLGLAVQAYLKRAPAVIDWLVRLAEENSKRMSVRLVKGAYWDTEIKQAQVEGLDSYPVFTRKESTDLSYLVCAQKMLENSGLIHSQFATHNAHTLAAIMEMAKDGQTYEMQRLHGMGETLYDLVRKDLKAKCRIYAPVGEHRDLLAYLVRRLLENGANSSFVHQVIDDNIPIKQLVANPVEEITKFEEIAHPKVPLPKDTLKEETSGYRLNSSGVDLADYQDLCALKPLMDAFAKNPDWRATSIIGGKEVSGKKTHDVLSPQNTKLKVGEVTHASAQQMQDAVECAKKAQDAWFQTPVHDRANALRKLSVVMEENRAELLTLLSLEAGKSIPDAVAELREAVDFCRYYANQAEKLMAEPENLPGPTGEDNQLSHYPRGTFVCISPWNFPLAIFLGQVTAALATGNTVIAKPAEVTSLIAHRVVELAHQTGIPADALNLVIGSGSKVGEHIVKAKDIDGVVFTGSTAIAQHINQTLAHKDGAIVPLIAETGGINAMIVDSSALLEQVVDDVVSSAFQSAGQRCSALRILYVQEDIADSLLEMLKGAMYAQKVGNPSDISTDVGPVISERAQEGLLDYVARLEEEQKAKLVYKCEVADADKGWFVPPQAWELSDPADLTCEVFGPILHIVRYKQKKLDDVMTSINARGFGLTLGVHSRIRETVDFVRKHARVGNLYVNRNTIGAVVGVQPFGGEGLSGTGPKAGGPQYLMRFVVERTFTDNITAAGGNATLLAEV